MTAIRSDYINLKMAAISSDSSIVVSVKEWVREGVRMRVSEWVWVSECEWVSKAVSE